MTSVQHQAPASPTTADSAFTFKVAADRDELDQIHRLNYRTFVEEIPQHAPNDSRVLVDKFDADNAYLICRRGDRVVGMIAIRERRPFSLDGKLAGLDAFLPPHHRVCEIRLLAVDPAHRSGVVFRGLMVLLNQYTRDRGFDLGVISGTPRQAKLYRHLGFVAFGPLVGTAEAPFQPMYVTRESFERLEHDGVLAPPASNGAASHARRPQAAHDGRANGVPVGPAERQNFLPGPVAIHPAVWSAFLQAPVSHRHPAFIADASIARAMLSRLVGAPRTQLLVGSGTLANDAIAAQLSLGGRRGLVCVNGEFGERLADHAARFALPHDVLRVDWGRGFDAHDVARALDRVPRGGWCWMVHCETSTGVLNDLPAFADLCEARDIRLCADCVSSIGTVPVDLRRVHLASGVSGKAIGGLPGLSMVFHHDAIAPSGSLPRYLDLGYYAASGGVPFTQSSNLLAALRVAVERTAVRSPFSELAALAPWLRDELRRRGFTLIGEGAQPAPGIVTIACERGGGGTALGDALADAGFDVSYRSEYLRVRDWVQVALMSDASRTRLEPLLDAMDRARSAGETVARRVS